MPIEVSLSPCNFGRPGLTYYAQIREGNGGRGAYGDTPEAAKANLEWVESQRMHTADDGTAHCADCFSPSTDINFGFGDRAVPDGCSDGDCSCHQKLYTADDKYGRSHSRERGVDSMRGIR